MKFALIAVLFATSTIQVAAAGQMTRPACRKISTAMSAGDSDFKTESKAKTISNVTAATAQKK